MKKRFEIYISEEDLLLIERLKKDTGYRKPGMAIVAAIHSYFRYQDKIKKLLNDRRRLENELKDISKP